MYLEMFIFMYLEICIEIGVFEIIHDYIGVFVIFGSIWK